MAARTRWLVVAALVAAIAVAFLFRRGCRVTPPDAPVAPRSFTVEHHAPVQSPDLEVGPVLVGGTTYRGYTDWACFLECREPEGCKAEVRLVVDYTADGAGGRVVIAGSLDAESGETMRLGRAEWPPVAAVDRVDRVTLEVVRFIGPDVPTPFVVF